MVVDRRRFSRASPGSGAPVYSLTSVIQSSGRIRRRGTSYIICQQPTRSTRNEIVRHSAGPREIKDIRDFTDIDQAWYRLLTIEETCLRTPISQFLDNVPYRCRPHINDRCSVCLENDAVKETTRSAEEAAMRDRRSRWLDLEDKLLKLKEMYCTYCLLDPYNPSPSIHHAQVECPRCCKDPIASRLRQQVKRELVGQQLPRPGSGCFRCLMPKNLCTKQQENNRLEEDECLMDSFLPDTIAVLFQFRDRLDNVMSGVPIQLTHLSGFVHQMINPCEAAALQTMHIVEILSRLDVVEITEALEGYSDQGDAESDPGENGLDLRMLSPIEEPNCSWRKTVLGDVSNEVEGGRNRKRKAEKRLSQIFQEEKARTQNCIEEDIR